MSELKAFNCVESDLQEFCEPRLVYLKSEADKVIEDLEESHKKEVGQLLIEIAELKKEKEYVIEHTADVINGQERKIQHLKYKLCFAMARRCFTKSNYHFVLARHGEDAKENNRRSILYSKWRNLWFKISEKFKTNSTINRKEAPMPCNGKKTGGKKPPKK